MRYTEKDYKLFSESADVLAPWLLGKLICRRLPDATVVKVRITETEAYSHDDTACYGKDGRITDATAPLFEKGGTFCVYAGMLLIACGATGKPDNVLIRKAGNRTQYYNGPILLCEALGVDKKLHGVNLLDSNSLLWIEDDGKDRDYCQSERIGLGINVTESDREKKLRFISI